MVRQAIANHAARVQLRAWPGHPTMGHLTLLDVDMIPTVDDVAGWTADATTANDERDAYSSVRTGALFPAAAEPFRALGFVEVDRLALLARSLDTRAGRRPTPPANTSATRLRERDLSLAAEVDATAFDADWRNDESALADIAAATPQQRGRLVTTRSARPVGPWADPAAAADVMAFAITGRAGDVGYLQRLAVRPAARRQGVARYLVDDACRWLTRRGARQVLVNTGVDNLGALTLYERCGFTRRRDELVVLQLDG